MSYIQKLRKLFLYAGVEREEYHRLLPMIREKNRELLRVSSLVAAVMFFLLYIASLLSNGFATVNSTTYLVCGIGMLMIQLCSGVVLSKHPKYTILFVYLSQILLYAFGTRISLLHADKAAVSAVAFLLVSPLLFYDRPIRLAGLTTFVVVGFCMIVSRYKAPDVAETDVWNMVTFGAVAVATTVFMMSIKIRTLIQSRQIEYMSETDLLTGVKNRNLYESRLKQYARLSGSKVICVYADVNGMHELNNREGHIAGDKMLCTVAETLLKHFDAEHVYRVGGDEFIAFRVNGQTDDMPSEINEIRQELGQKGYHVSFGFAVSDPSMGKTDMQAIVNEADDNMRADKRAFYSRSEHNRRSR